MSQVNLFLLRTCLLCVPPFAFGIVAGLGFRATMADYMCVFITAVPITKLFALHRERGDFVPVQILGVCERDSPGPQSRGDTGAARGRVRTHELAAGARRPPAPTAPAAPASTRLLSLVQGVMHLVLVDMLLFDLKHLGSAGGVHVQLALSALAWLRPTERSAPSSPTTWPHRPSSRGCHRCWL
jgi:hypothetical protein